MDLRLATVDDQPSIRRLLQKSGLPVDNLDTAAIEFFVITEADELIGAVGIEPFDTIGLLRSLAVRDDRRGDGMGAQLVDTAERHATVLGLRQLVLLTETAEPFFAKRGYIPIPRDQAPPAIRISAEFRSICPISAICMIKPLETRQ